MFKKLIVVLLITVCLWQPAPVYAHGGGGGRGVAIASLAVGGAALLIGAANYYRNPPAGYAIVQQPIIYAAGYPVVYAGGLPYYYAAAPAAYAPPATVFAAPAPAPAAVPPAPQAVTSIPPAPLDSATRSEPFEIFIPNGNGSFTSITLQKTDKGFLGPQGEFYPDHPAEEQLRERYLKK